MRTPPILRKLALTAALAALPAASFGSVFISVGIAPPLLPVYAQPICPGDGYLWTPGYWAWSEEDQGYFWVPGVWVQPPTVGVLWTPAYWGWESGAYLFHPGYWGPHIGFYGGVNYGFGYTGFGYEGGYWNHGAFAYNRAVNNINVINVHNVYNKTVIVNNNTTINRVSYNGGNGGLQARPSPQEQAAVREQHLQPTPNQMSHQTNAAQNRAQFASFNHGRPPMAAQARIGDRSNVVPARGVPAPQNGFGNAHPQRGTQPNTAPRQQRGFAAQPNSAQQQQQQQQQAQRQGQPGSYQPQARPQQSQPQLQTRPAQPQTQPRQSTPQPRPQSQQRESQPRGGDREQEHR